MRFKKIKIKNVRSYIEQEVEFPEGSLLLSGDVGTGKTSILLALEYALFGLQPGQKGSSLLRNNKQIGEVILEFEVDGKSITLERKLKRTSKGVSNEYAAITIDDQRKESSVTEIKSLVIELLGYPPEFVKRNNVLYRYTVYSPQEQMKQIILEDPEIRLNTLRHIFGINKYRQIKNNLSILLVELKARFKFLQGEISTLNKDRENLQIRKMSLKGISSKIEESELELARKISIRKQFEEELKKLEEKTSEKTKLESESEKTKVLLTSKRENLASLKNEIIDLNKAIQEIGETFNEGVYLILLNKINLKREELEELNSEYVSIISKINSLQKEKNDILKKKERIFSIDICPTCLQDVPEHHKHNILNETETKITQIKKELSSLNEEDYKASKKIQFLKQEILKLENDKSKLEIQKTRLEHFEKSKSKLADAMHREQALEYDIDMLAKHIESTKEKIFSYFALTAQTRKKREELENAFLVEKNAEIFLAELKKELEFAHREINLLEAQIKEKEKSQQRMYEINEMIDWFSSKFLSLIDLIERNVLIKLRSEFSSLFRKWFSLLIPEGTLDSQIDENFTPVIMQSDIELDYSFLSGGERTAIALAYRLALNQTINSVLSKIKTRGVIILDEPTDGFSETQISKMREIFEELNAEQLIIVSHEQKIEGFVDNVLKVNKELGTSSIVPERTLTLFTP